MTTTQEKLVIGSVLSFLKSSEGSTLQYDTLFGIFSVAHALQGSNPLQAHTMPDLKACALVQAVDLCLERVEQLPQAKDDNQNQQIYTHASGAQSHAAATAEPSRMDASFSLADGNGAPCTAQALRQQLALNASVKPKPPPLGPQEQALHNLLAAYSKSAMRDGLDRRGDPTYLDFAFTLLVAAFCCRPRLLHLTELLPKAWGASDAARAAALPYVERTAAGRRELDAARLLALFIASETTYYKLAAACMVFPKQEPQLVDEPPTLHLPTGRRSPSPKKDKVAPKSAAATRPQSGARSPDPTAAPPPVVVDLQPPPSPQAWPGTAAPRTSPLRRTSWADGSFMDDPRQGSYSASGARAAAAGSPKGRGRFVPAPMLPPEARRTLVEATHTGSRSAGAVLSSAGSQGQGQGLGSRPRSPALEGSNALKPEESTYYDLIREDVDDDPNEDAPGGGRGSMAMDVDEQLARIAAEKSGSDIDSKPSSAEARRKSFAEGAGGGDGGVGAISFKFNLQPSSGTALDELLDAAMDDALAMPAPLELCTFAVLAPMWPALEATWAVHGLQGLLPLLDSIASSASMAVTPATGRHHSYSSPHGPAGLRSARHTGAAQFGGSLYDPPASPSRLAGGQSFTAAGSPRSPRLSPRGRSGHRHVPAAPVPEPDTQAVQLLCRGLRKWPDALGRLCPEALALAARASGEVLGAVAGALVRLSGGQMARPELWRGASVEVLCGQLALLGIDVVGLVEQELALSSAGTSANT